MGTRRISPEINVSQEGFFFIELCMLQKQAYLVVYSVYGLEIEEIPQQTKTVMTRAKNKFVSLKTRFGNIFSAVVF